MAEIIQKEDPRLRQKAEPVAVKEIAGEVIQRAIRQMSGALEAEPDGVALAATQIGLPRQLFIVSGKVFLSQQPESRQPKKKPANLVFINPKITRQSKESLWQEEGCLSVRWFYGLVSRRTKVTVEAYNEHGKKFIRHTSGLLAQICQHEIDHLDGVLFTDKAKDVTKIKPA